MFSKVWTLFFFYVFGFRIAADYLIDIMQTLVFIEPIFLEHRPFGSSLEDPWHSAGWGGRRQSNDWLRWPLLKEMIITRFALKAEMMYYPSENQDFLIHTDIQKGHHFSEENVLFKLGVVLGPKFVWYFFPQHLHETSAEFHLCQQGASAGFLQHQH